MRKLICRILPALLALLMLTGACALADAPHFMFQSLPEITFLETHFYGGQSFPIYSGPGTRYARMAGGYASASTDDVIYAAGWVDGWLLVRYSISGGERVGYVHQDKISGGQGDGVWGGADRKALNLSSLDGLIVKSCNLTDDPSQLYGKAIRQMAEGERVKLLGGYENGFYWIYIETTVDGKLVRAFVPEDCVTVY